MIFLLRDEDNSGSICTENPHGNMTLKRTVNQAGLRVTLSINVSVMFKMGTQLITRVILSPQFPVSNEDSMSSDINILPKAMELSGLDDDDINEDISVTDGTCFSTITGTVSSDSGTVAEENSGCWF